MNKETQSTGIGFTSLLLIAFIVLKLCNVIAWSWWWVLSPFWIPCALAIVAIAVAFIWGSKDEQKPKADTRSKWQQRMEEMQKKQNADVN